MVDVVVSGSGVTVDVGGVEVVIDTGEQTGAAQAAAAQATLAATAAAAAGRYFVSQAAGEAGSTTGQFFSHPDGAGGLVYRERTGGGSTIIAYAATKAQVDAKMDLHPMQAAIGVLTTQAIDTSLAGAPVPANLGPLFMGHNTVSADSVTWDTAGNWPPGDAMRRSAGTLAAPTPVTAGMQLGYRDFRGYNTDGGNGYYFNAASFDVKISSAIAFGDGDTPPTDMGFYICWDFLNALNAGSFISYGPTDGAGLWVGWAGVGGAESLQPTGGSKPRTFAVTKTNDWAAMVDSRPVSGQANGQRIDINKTTSADTAQALYANGTLINRTSGDGVNDVRSHAIKGQLRQAFMIRITNTGGTIQHRIGSHLDSSAAGSWNAKITGASAALANTPTGTDGSTGFTSGAKISSVSPSVLILDVAAQDAADIMATARVIFNTSTDSVVIWPLANSRNVNGTTRVRLELQLLNATTGAAINWSTALGVGEVIDVQVEAYLA